MVYTPCHLQVNSCSAVLNERRGSRNVYVLYFIRFRCVSVIELQLTHIRIETILGILHTETDILDLASMGKTLEADPVLLPAVATVLRYVVCLPLTAGEEDELQLSVLLAVLLGSHECIRLCAIGGKVRAVEHDVGGRRARRLQTETGAAGKGILMGE